MDWTKLFQRVYIRINEMYNVQMTALASLDLMELLHEVAKKTAGNIEPLYDAATDKIYERRTKRFIVQEVNKFIAGMPEILSINENMASFASLNQLNLLIRAFNNEKKQISCFGLIYMYIIYTQLERKSSLAKDCAIYVNILHDLVMDYHEDHPEDEVVAFFLGCYTPILLAIKEKNTHLTNKSLPPRPCKHPRELDA